ncbi:putative membrane protein [Tamaricihabitans halophyticus]|uniref:Putative membrane protein n=1 Tax=Tamaricihabitans halophyticus TaxID=1262583 RepID=A0A4R2R189_9PSEU|nr:vitamin K epoxide reductase family protein [Tamaricihabitans halophyticus]TCP56440.1 putative membrane protein [Tamaricihabitans halophyticus]
MTGVEPEVSQRAGSETDRGPLGRIIGWLYVIGGGIGLAAAAALLLEKITSLEDTGYVPSCDISPILSCGSVMVTPQAEAFGFPNPIIGVAGFAVLVTVGMVLLTGFRPPRWFWLGLQLGTTFGVVFIHWLIYQSLYEIGALCPYCMVVWAVTIPIFWYTTLHNLERGHFSSGGAGTVGSALVRFHSVALVVWFLVIVVLILQRFWTYWSGLF